MSGEIRIGTSGWHYNHWRGLFYPRELPVARWFDYYTRFFNTVEINNSFYKLPSAATFLNWRLDAPPGFLYAVKASRYITHMKKLGDPYEGLGKFMPLTEVLKEKLGPILFQLPPRWRCNLERLEAFLTALPQGHRYVFELRDESWLNRDVYALLSRFNAAFCIYELAGFRSPLEVTADFVYVRLHGPQGAYQGSYTPATLSQWAERVRAWRDSSKSVYVYFDNDQAAYAAHNAIELKRLVEGEQAERARA